MASKPKKTFGELKVKLDGIVAKANTIISKMDDLFLLEKFEREMFRETANHGDVIAPYKDYVKRLNEQDRKDYGNAKTSNVSIPGC